ncbi:MAG TPA: hypothetical protein DIW17_05915 [Clostridiales bacterium]|jgi:Mn-dependent DtxR family transcriptional regulator|uniref:hypothetical protein n=1 Tax=Syntrophomonas wolfei TaxID=863 RepID=UPI000EE39E1A|nr:hypothetical protein [Syntrophomonas wolfei]HCS73395.1 hypothetical protein [Clostridiales bacterium]
MAITKRRLDFLRNIKQLYDATGLPVHYARVAEALGVSKWSAYEMLKNLEKEGFLDRQYEVNQVEKNPGRAMVMFLPTHKLDQVLFAKTLDSKLKSREWEQEKERLLSLFDELRKGNGKALFEQLATELPSLENPLISCAYIITLLVSQMQILSENSLRLLENMAVEARKGPVGLAMFVGTAIGSLLKSAAPISLVAQLSDFFSVFQNNLIALTKSEEDLLQDFLEMALVKVL